MSSLVVGNLVVHPEVPGLARVGEVRADKVRLDCFESVTTPVAKQVWARSEQCRHVRLALQTRVFWQDPDTGTWHAGRVVGGEPPVYFIRFPNSREDRILPESALRVRWDRPASDPLAVLISGGNESPFFRDARLPMLSSLVRQRAACGNIPALLSSAAEFYPHQVQAALTILNDPVQRYLLADEVGLGKTIERHGSRSSCRTCSGGSGEANWWTGSSLTTFHLPRSRSRPTNPRAPGPSTANSTCSWSMRHSNSSAPETRTRARTVNCGRLRMRSRACCCCQRRR